MAAKSKALEPTLLQVIRLGKTSQYDLADKLDWAVLFDNTVLEIRAADGATYYWPIDSVTLWKTTPKPNLNGHA